jgi:hypothetical protein
VSWWLFIKHHQHRGVPLDEEAMDSIDKPDEKELE